MSSSSIPVAPAEPAPSSRQRKAQAAGWWIAFALTFVLGAALRLYALDLTDLRYDEASGARFGWQVARGEWFAALPNTGSVANHPPVYAWLMAVPYLFTRDFLAVAAYRALIDVLALALCGWMCARHFNRRVAIVAMLCFATAPWAVLFARKLFTQPMPIFSVLLLFGLLEVTRRRNPWSWTIAGWGLALAVGSHWSALYLAPVVLVTAVWCHRTLRPLPVLVGLWPGLLLAGGYLWQDAPGGFANVRSLLSAASGSATVGLDALWRALWLSTGLHLSDLTGPAYGVWRATMPADLDAFGWAQAAFILAGAGLLIVQTVRRAPSCQSSNPLASAGRDGSGLALLLFVLLPVALQLRHSQPVQMHYLLPIYPAPFVILACGIDAALTWAAGRRGWGARLVRAGLPAAVAIILLGQVWMYAQLMAFIAMHDTSDGGYGPPARHALALARLAQDRLCADERCAGPREVIVVAPGADPTVNEQAAIWDVLLAGTPHRFADGKAGLILPCQPAQYVFAPGSEAALQRLRHWLADASARVEWITISVRPGSASTMTAARVDDACRPDYSWSLSTPRARWEHGATLLHHRVAWTEDRKAMRIDLYLRVEAAPPAGADFHWFNHVLAGGEKIAQADGGGIHPANWRVGDVLWHWFEIALPAGLDAGREDIRLRVGSYTYPQLENVPLTLADGRASDGLEIPVQVPIEALP